MPLPSCLAHGGSLPEHPLPVYQTYQKPANGIYMLVGTALMRAEQHLAFSVIKGSLKGLP